MAVYQEQLKSGLHGHWDLLSHLDSPLFGGLHYLSRKQLLRTHEFFISVLHLRLTGRGGADG